jgi:hypothetical protein
LGKSKSSQEIEENNFFQTFRKNHNNFIAMRPVPLQGLVALEGGIVHLIPTS